MAWGVPIPVLLLAASLLGLVISSLAAVVAALRNSAGFDPEHDALHLSTLANEGTEWT